MSLSWPPSGIQTPPCGPVIIFSSAACAVAVAKPATIIDAKTRIFIGRSPWDTRRLAGRSCCLALRLRGRVGRRQAGLRVGTNLTPPGAPIHKKNAAIHKFGFEPERLRLIGPHPTVQCTSVWSPFHQARVLVRHRQHQSRRHGGPRSCRHRSPLRGDGLSAHALLAAFGRLEAGRSGAAAGIGQSLRDVRKRLSRNSRERGLRRARRPASRIF